MTVESQPRDADDLNELRASDRRCERGAAGGVDSDVAESPRVVCRASSLGCRWSIIWMRRGTGG